MMSEKVVEITIPLLLPEPDGCNQCIEKLLERLMAHRGILQAHIHYDHDPIELCVHYDPNFVSLAAVKRIAETVDAELRNGFHHEEIRFAGLDSADSAVLLTQVLEKLPGMLHASVNYAAGLTFVAYDAKQLPFEQILYTLRQYGARPVSVPAPADRETAPLAGRAIAKGHDHGEEHEHDAPAFLPLWMQAHWTMILVSLAGIALLIGWMVEKFLHWPAVVCLVFYLLSYLASGSEPAHHALPALLKGKFDTDVLMLAAAVGAAVLGQWAEGAFLLFLFGIGHAGEHYALDRARNAINALGELMPKTARVLRGGQIVEEPVDQLVLADVVVIRPGDRIPVDGVVIQGSSAVDQSPITGESVPVQKHVQDEVFAGTINQEAALEVRVTHLAQDTTLSRVIKMVAEAQAQQSPTQQFTERFTAYFVPAVLILVVLVAVVPPLAGWMPFSQSFYRAMLLLVAASPCALAIGTPAAVLSGIARAARGGVLIKGGVHLENLGRLNVIAFDKTGTLTEGRFQVTDVVPLDGVGPQEVLRVAAAVEQQSNHPLALAIVQAAQRQNLALPAIAGLENVPGLGVRGQVDGQPVWIGSLKLFEAQAGLPVAKTVRETVARFEAAGRTTMTISRNGEYFGVLALSDVPRPGVAAVLSRLRQSGIQRLVMLTGDNPAVAGQIGEAVGVTGIKASLLPEDKLGAIQSLQKEYGAVAMVGDGVNDAPALATATVGIAMGGAGTAVALETADVALMADDLSKLPFAVGLSRASRAIIQQNLAISLGVIVLLIVSSVLGWIQLGWTVAFHEGSTVLVALNALRLLTYELPKETA
jgi:Cd2+/Zn2+-exporting ATPase